MNGEERRKHILARLTESSAPVSATCLAGECNVTRQIIVADIALLRAGGCPIRAEHKGYVLDKEETPDKMRRVVVKHGKEAVRDEFYAVVDNGGSVLDVIVDHSMYGKISVELNITSRFDADEFVQKISETGVYPLSLLTEGLHVHTILIKDEASYRRILDKLTALKILIDYD